MAERGGMTRVTTPRIWLFVAIRIGSYWLPDSDLGRRATTATYAY